MNQANQQRCKRSCEEVKGSHLLVLHDTTDFNYTNKGGLHSLQDPHLGPIGHKKSGDGYLLHCSLVVNARHFFPLGLSEVYLWNRKFGQADSQQRKYSQQPIEEKESFKWLRNMRISSEVLKEHTQVTHVMDRDGDIYELFAEQRHEGHHLLVRQCRQRNIEQQDKLSDWLKQVEAQSSYQIKVRGTDHRRERTARVHLSFGKVTLKRPSKTPEHYPETITLSVVQVKEYEDSVPAAEAPLHWVLYTTHPGDDIQMALQVIQWYGGRWGIEEFFSLLKTKGLNLEDSQLENGLALKKLCMMSAQVALTILQLIKDRTNEYGQKAELVISQKEMAFVYALIKSLEGQTMAQKNPYPEQSLAWLAWAIARLGGWKGYAKESPPGPKTMSQGIQRFWQTFEGWSLMQGDTFF